MWVAVGTDLQRQLSPSTTETLPADRLEKC